MWIYCFSHWRKWQHLLQLFFCILLFLCTPRKEHSYEHKIFHLNICHIYYSFLVFLLSYPLVYPHCFTELVSDGHSLALQLSVLFGLAHNWWNDFCLRIRRADGKKVAVTTAQSTVTIFLFSLSRAAQLVCLFVFLYDDIKNITNRWNPSRLVGLLKILRPHFLRTNTFTTQTTWEMGKNYIWTMEHEGKKLYLLDATCWNRFRLLRHGTRPAAKWTNFLQSIALNYIWT